MGRADAAGASVKIGELVQVSGEVGKHGFARMITKPGKAQAEYTYMSLCTFSEPGRPD